MRPIWSGYINFGLVNIPVNLQSAEKHEQMHFHLLDARDNARIRYQKINEETGKEVPWDKIQRGYEYTKGKYVILKDEDFKKISIAAKTIAIENFVDKDEIDYEYFERPYYLVPDKARLPYKLSGIGYQTVSLSNDTNIFFPKCLHSEFNRKLRRVSYFLYIL